MDSPARRRLGSRAMTDNPADDESEINLTSMLDVVFIMLIFFIVTATFLDEDGIPVFLPSNFGELPIVESIVVTVKPASTFVVNKRVLSKASLVPYLNALRAQNPEASFGVVVTEGSRVGDAVAAADAGRVIGYDVIPISTE